MKICPKCGRKLRNPKSIELGYGPVCYKRKFGITSHISHKDTTVSVSAGENTSHSLPGQIFMKDYLQTFLGQ